MDDPRKTTVGPAETAKRGKRRPMHEEPEVPEEQAQPEAAPAPSKPAVIAGLPVEQAASLAPSAALIAVGLLLESELLVGIAIGTGIAMASKWAPEPISGAVLPLVNSTLKACYTAAVRMGEMLGEAIEGVEGAIAGIAGAPKEPEAPKAAQGQPSEGSANLPGQTSDA